MTEPELCYSFRDLYGILGEFFLPANTELLVGREGHGAHVQLPIPVMARQHMRLVNSNGACTIEKVGARCGIYVNGEEIGYAGTVVALAPGDQIITAGHRFLVGLEPRPNAGGDA